MWSLIDFDANDLYKCRDAPIITTIYTLYINIIVKLNIFSNIYSVTRTYVYLIQDIYNIIPINDIGTHDDFGMNNKKICKTRNKNNVEIIFYLIQY